MTTRLHVPKANRILRPPFGFILGEVFLGFLAIVAAVLTLIPLFFKIPARLHALLEGGQWSIVFLFAVEYGISLVSATLRSDSFLIPGG